MNDKRKMHLGVNRIVIDEDINIEMAKYVDEAIGHFSANGNPDIEVVITSNGGDVDLGLYVFDMIDTYRGKTHGRVASFARSMAAVILQACTTREAGRHSKILIHHITRRQVSLDVLKDSTKLSGLVAGMEKTQDKLYRILESRTSRNRDEIIKACLPDTDMSAEEALVFGLISSITSSSLKDDQKGDLNRIVEADEGFKRYDVTNRRPFLLWYIYLYN